MDRVGEITRQINDDWTEFNEELQRLGLVLKSDEIKDLHKKLDALRCQYANLIALGQEETWPFFAESNGVVLPDDEEGDAH